VFGASCRRQLSRFAKLPLSEISQLSNCLDACRKTPSAEEFCDNYQRDFRKLLQTRLLRSFIRRAYY